MALSMDQDGRLVEVYKSLEVNGVRYLLKPANEVSYCKHLLSSDTDAKAPRGYNSLVT